MNYSYYDDGSFTFNIDKGVNDKEGGNYRIYISVTQKTLPELGERYYFKKQIDNSGPFEFEDKCYIASIEVFRICINVRHNTYPRKYQEEEIILKTDVVKRGI